MTNPTPIRVGIIGLNPGIHWGATAHVPALASLPDDYKLIGVANTSLACAERAAEAFGLKHAFPNAQALVESPEVDGGCDGEGAAPPGAGDGGAGGGQARVLRVAAGQRAGGGARAGGAGEGLAPDFDDAVALHRLVDAIGRSAAQSGAHAGL